MKSISQDSNIYIFVCLFLSPHPNVLVISQIPDLHRRDGLNDSQCRFLCSSCPSSSWDLTEVLTHRRLHSRHSRLLDNSSESWIPTNSGAETHLSGQLGLFSQLAAQTQFKGTCGAGVFVSSVGEALTEGPCASGEASEFGAPIQRWHDFTETFKEFRYCNRWSLY